MNGSWKATYYHACGRHGIPVAIAQRILRHANTCQRAAEVDCSVSSETIRDAWKMKRMKAERAIRSALVGASPRFRAEFGGDPRGCVVRLVSESSPDGIGVPGAGFTASQIERLSAVTL